MSSEATQTVGVYDVLAWLETNKKQLIIGFVVAVVVGFGIAIYRYSSDQKELAASDALLQLKTTLTASDNSPAPPASAYLDVAKRYPGTDAAQRAIFLAGVALYSEGKYAEARAQLSQYLKDNPQSPFAAEAAYGIAACQEAEGNTNDALAGYQNLSVRFPNAGVLDDAKLAVARLYEAKNQPEQALRIYDELSKVGTMGTAGTEAMTRKEALLAKHPELVKTNAPAALSAAPVISSGTNVSVTLSTNAAGKK